MSEEEKGYGKPPKKHQFKKGFLAIQEAGLRGKSPLRLFLKN